MKSIKSTISKPFMIMLVVIPLCAMIVFNVVMNYYFNNAASRDLADTATGIESMIRRELQAGAAKGSLNDAALSSRLSLMSGPLRISRLVSRTEFVLLNPAGKVIFPLRNSNFLNQDIIKIAAERLQKVNNGQVVSFRADGREYFAVQKMTGLNDRVMKVLFVASNEAEKGVLWVVNIVLAAIFMLGISISLIVTNRISSKIVQPILKLNGYAKQIGSGNFIALPQDKSSLEISELTAAMNNMSSSLKEKENVRNMFLQNSSHELRTPLMSIRGYAEGIMAGVFADQKKAAEVIQGESIRLTSIVDQMLTLSKIENKTYKADLIEYNLPDLIKAFMPKLQGYALQENKQLTFSCEEDFVPVKADETLLLQAFSNIVANCIKFAETMVTIHVCSSNGRAVIKISDNGRGISPEELPHLFERFYKGKDGNFGLGLSIAKSAVEFMGGSIQAFNDKGAVFEVVFPDIHP